MVQSLVLGPRIFHSGCNSRDTLGLIKKYIKARDHTKHKKEPSWILVDLKNHEPSPNSILCVTEVDLKDFYHEELRVPWSDINIIVIETYWQLLFYRKIIDVTKQYILILDSWFDDDQFNKWFSWINLVDRFAFKYDCADILRLLSVSDPSWQIYTKKLSSKSYRTFCLLGRTDLYRDHFVKQLVANQPQQSLVKYNGRPVLNTAHDFDTRGYRHPAFVHPVGPNGVSGSFHIMSELYENFKFETVVETTQWHYGGWVVNEYDITEKTLKPMMAGVPAVILAPQGYHAWLRDRFGIDVACGLFEHDQDLERDCYYRLDKTVTKVQQLASDLCAEPDPTIISRNRQALIEIADWNIAEIRRCVDLLCGL